MTEQAVKQTANWQSRMMTGVLSLMFVIMLKPNVGATLSFFELAPLFSRPMWYTILVAVSIGILFIYMRRVGVDLFGGIAMGFGAVVFLSTIYSTGDLSWWAMQIAPCVAAVLVVAAFARQYGRNLLQGMFIASSFYLICNLVFLLQQPDLLRFDAYEELFFGYRNITFRIAIPAIICSALLDVCDGKRFSVRTATVYCLSLLEILAGYSATSASALLLMGLVMLLIQAKRTRPLFNGAVYVVMYLVIFLAVIVFRLQDKLSFVIENLLGRTVTFTGRTFIWDNVFQLLDLSHLIKGYGMSYMDNAIVVNGVTYQHAHNELLHIILLGGIGALLFFSLLIFLAVRKLYQHRRDLFSALLSTALLGFAIIGLFEVVCYPGSFFLLALSYYQMNGCHEDSGFENGGGEIASSSNR